MRTRILPAAEWGRLPLETAAVLEHVYPQDAEVTVIETDDGEIIGCSAVVRLTHLLGAWIEPSHRGNPGICRALLKGTFRAARASAARWILAATEDRTIERVLARVGAVPAPTGPGMKGYIVDMTGGTL